MGETTALPREISSTRAPSFAMDDRYGVLWITADVNGLPDDCGLAQQVCAAASARKRRVVTGRHMAGRRNDRFAIVGGGLAAPPHVFSIDYQPLITNYQNGRSNRSN
jgi:hypothetical protein